MDRSLGDVAIVRGWLQETPHKWGNFDLISDIGHTSAENLREGGSKTWNRSPQQGRSRSTSCIITRRSITILYTYTLRIYI